MLNSIKEAPRKYIFEPTADAVIDRLGDGAKYVLSNVWESFVQFIPDLAGYGMMAAGIGVILGVMTGRGMLKPLGYLAGGLVVAVGILEAV